jgi:N-acetylmuramoyl-L-alanine amidase
MAYQVEEVNNHLIVKLPGTSQGLAMNRYELEGNIASQVTVKRMDQDNTVHLDIQLRSAIETYFVNKSVDGKMISIIMVPIKAKVPPTAPIDTKKITVVIDPGHGGKDTGAISYTRNLNEKDVNLKIALQVQKLLEKAGVNIIITRNDDRFVELNDRSKIANDAKADLFISIHCDAVVNPAANGTGTFSYTPAGNQLLLAQQYQRSLLADLLQKELVTQLGRANRGVRQANFAVLRETKMPAALVEVAFISNPEEEKLLADSSFQQKAATAIAEAVQKYIKLML